MRALEEGDTDISLRQIARMTGVSAMAPYRHFPDKQALMKAVTERGFAMLGERLREADSNPDHREALLAQGLAYIAFARERPALFRLMFGSAGGHPPPTHDSAYGVLVARVGSLVPGYVRDEAALLCWATVHGLATLALDGAGIPSASRAALALLVDGLPSA